MTAINLNEQFGAFVTDINPPDNWASPTAGGYAGSDNWFDQIYLSDRYLNLNPHPTNPQTPLGTTKVDHATQEWRMGSTTVGQGVKVQTNTLQRFTDHGTHTNIVSPSP